MICALLLSATVAMAQTDNTVRKSKKVSKEQVEKKECRQECKQECKEGCKQNCENGCKQDCKEGEKCCQGGCDKMKERPGKGKFGHHPRGGHHAHGMRHMHKGDSAFAGQSGDKPQMRRHPGRGFRGGKEFNPADTAAKKRFGRRPPRHMNKGGEGVDATTGATMQGERFKEGKEFNPADTTARKRFGHRRPPRRPMKKPAESADTQKTAE